MTASVWNPGSNNIPAVDPLSQIKSQIFTATEGQTDFTITQFTYSLGNGAIDVYVNRSKVPASELTELSSTSFRIPACDVDDLVEVRGNTAVSDPGSAVALAQAAAAAALASEQAAELAETNAETAATSATSSASSASASAAAAASSAAIAAQYVPLDWEGAWLTATAYQVNDAVKQAGSSYICLVAHTSGVFADDLTANKWDIIAEKGAAGTGTGDMLGANNLSDVADAATSRANLGLGSAATTASTAYATAAQGAKADTAVQPANIANMLETADIGVTVQAYYADTAKLDVDQNWSGAQRASANTDNDLNFDLAAGNNFVCTPTGSGALTFTNIAEQAGQSGYIKLVNGANYVISLHANTKMLATDTSKISVTGTYLISYFNDGTNVLCTASGNLA